MSKQKEDLNEDILGIDQANIQETISRSEEFINKNKQIILGSLLGAILIAGAYFYYSIFYMPAQETKAMEAMFAAELYFEKDSFDLALNGGGSNYGMLQVADEYGSTKAGNLANYYAGIAYLKKGEYQNAITYLSKFSGNDVMVRNLAIGAMGDAYAELGDNTKAIEHYKKAANREQNSFTTPYFLMKAGQLMEITGDKSGALRAYQQIRDQFKDSNEGMNIDKFIARAGE